MFFLLSGDGTHAAAFGTLMLACLQYEQGQCGSYLKALTINVIEPKASFLISACRSLGPFSMRCFSFPRYSSQVILPYWESISDVSKAGMNSAVILSVYISFNTSLSTIRCFHSLKHLLSCHAAGREFSVPIRNEMQIRRIQRVRQEPIPTTPRAPDLMHPKRPAKPEEMVIAPTMTAP